MHGIIPLGDIQRSNNRMSPPYLVPLYLSLISRSGHENITFWSAVSAVTSFLLIRVSRPSSFQNFFSDRLGKHAVPGYQGTLQGGPLTCLPSLPDCDMEQAPEAAAHAGLARPSRV